MNDNPKIIVTNIIVVVMAVLSIITLCVGNFFALKISVHIDDELLISAAKETQGEDSDIDFAAIFKGVNIDVPFSFEIKSAVLLQAVTGDSSAAVRSMLSNQMDVVIDDLLKLAEDVIKTFVTVTINTVVEEAKDETFKELAANMEGDPTDEQVMQQLQSEYGITQENIDALNSDMSDAVMAFFNGGTNEVSEAIENSETLDNLVAVYAEQALIEESGEGSYTQAEIDAKAQELKDEISDKFDDAIDEWAPEGEMGEDNIIAWLFNQVTGEEDADIQNLDDVKEYITDKIFGEMDEETIQGIGMILKTLGIFLLIVIGAWAYLILKILLKLFARNKTVGMFFPKFFGWMPYVIFAGIPTLLVKSLPSIIEKYSSQMGLDAGFLTYISQIQNNISIKFSSLTWVSALCALGLMILWFPYHRWRKNAKSAKRAGK